MRIFLDTANIDQIKQAPKLGVVSGVTTNPSLVSKEGAVDYEATAKKICSIIPGPISVEVLVEGKKGGKWYGRTRSNKLVFFEGSERSEGSRLGQLVEVKIGKTSPWALQGAVATEAKQF